MKMNSAKQDYENEFNKTRVIVALGCITWLSQSFETRSLFLKFHCSKSLFVLLYCSHCKVNGGSFGCAGVAGLVGDDGSAIDGGWGP